jgi:hypothetical protein
MEITAGELYLIGGAVCVVPEECGICKRPATVFEGRRAIDPMSSHIEGYCGECAAKLEAERRWEASLSDADRYEYERVRDEMHIAGSEAGSPDLDPRQLAEADACWTRRSAEYRAFRAAHGAPTEVP